MRISIDVQGDLAKMLREEGRKGAVATSRAMAQVGAAVKANWRSQIAAAGLGTRLGNTIRSQVFPKSGASLDAAALVYSRASKIVGAFDRGAVIRAKDGFWLAIPLPAAGKSNRGGRITPGQWERRTGRALRFVYRRGKTALLVDDGRVQQGARVMGRDGFSRAARGFRNRTVPVFALVPQVKLRKRLGLVPAAERIGAGLGARIVANWK